MSPSLTSSPSLMAWSTAASGPSLVTCETPGLPRVRYAMARTRSSTSRRLPPCCVRSRTRRAPTRLMWRSPRACWNWRANTRSRRFFSLTPYGATKAAAEMLLSCYAAAYGIKGCALRFSNVYGPGMAAKDSFVPRLMRAARSGTGVDVYGDGSQLRDLVHVDDIVHGLLTAWRVGHSGPLILASGKSDSVNDIVEAARKVTGAPIPARHVPPKPGEMPAVLVDISAAS